MPVPRFAGGLPISAETYRQLLAVFNALEAYWT